MSRSKLQRTLCVLVAAFLLALPLAAQTPREERATLMERLLSALWERLAIPLASLRNDATTASPKGAPEDSTDSTTADDSGDDTDGRAHIDPNG